MSRWKDRRRIAMLQCNVQTRTCSPRRSVIAGMAVLASQLGRLWTLCPVDVEGDGGEGEMVRGEEPFWRRTKPRQEEQACMCMQVPLQVCGCLWCLACVCARVPGWWMWIRMDGSRQMRSHLLQVPQEFHLPRLDSTGPCQGPGGQRLAGQTSRDRTCEAEAEGGCQCGAGASLRLPHSHSVPIASSIHTIRAQIPPHTSFARFGGASGAR